MSCTECNLSGGWRGIAFPNRTAMMGYSFLKICGINLMISRCAVAPEYQQNELPSPRSAAKTIRPNAARRHS